MKRDTKGFRMIGVGPDLTTIVPPNPIKPAISPQVHLSLTVAYTAIYGFLFVIVYVQLWMILYYKHKRFSYQSVFLFLCLLWAGLRTTLFSFYFKNCVLANNLNVFFYWLLYCFPVCLQFITLCLLVFFFAQVVFNTVTKFEPDRSKHAVWIGLCVSALIFLVTNITCAVIIKDHESRGSNAPMAISMVRVVINDSLFIFCGVALSYFIYRMSKITSANLVLEARGTSKCQALVTCVLTILLYTSRAVYNIIAVSQPLNKMLSFGYGWINVSDQADLVDSELSGYAYVSFGAVLFIWEFLPTFIVVLFFRVQRPRASEMYETLDGMSNSKDGPRAYFFDNPRRYDSDEDLSIGRSYNSRNGVYDTTGPYSVQSSSGSIPREYGSYDAADTSPPTVFTTASSLNVHQPNQPHFYDGT